MSGTIHSQTNGPITFSMVGQSTASKAALDVKYVFGGFTAELIATGDLTGSNVAYTINGETISQSEFYSYMAFMTFQSS